MKRGYNKESGFRGSVIGQRRGTMPNARHYCTAETLFGAGCANLVGHKGQLCKQHRKLAKRSKARWVRPELASAGVVISSKRPPNEVR